MAGTVVQRAKLCYFLSGALLMSGLAVLGLAPLASAQDIHAVVCRAPASVTIDRPANDSVLTSGQVELSGAVRQANQLEVYVDGTLDSIVPVGLTDTSYTSSVQLQEGTHSLKVVAIDTCQLGNGEASAVVTYQPAVVTASAGANVPTTVGDTSGVQIGAPVEETPVHQSILPPIISQSLERISGALDFESPVSAAGQQQLPQVARFGLLTAGALVVIFSQAVSAASVSGPLLQFAAHHIGLHGVAGSRLLASLLGSGFIVLAFLL